MNAPQRLTRERLLEVLNRNWWFSELPAELQRALVSQGTVRSYVPDQHIVEQGCHPEGIYAVLEGQIATLRQLPDDREFLVNLAGPGYWFADPSILLGQPMPHTVSARTSVRVLFVPAAVVQRLRNDNVCWANHFAELHAQRFLVAMNAVAEATVLHREEFLCQRLADLARGLGMSNEPNSPETMEIVASQSELALMIGVSRQTLNGYLADLESRGMVTVGYRTIHVHRSLLSQTASARRPELPSGAAKPPPLSHW